MAGAAIGSGSVISFAVAADRTVAPMVAQALRAPRFQLHAVHWLGLRSLQARDLTARLELAPHTPLLDIDVDALCDRVGAHPRVQECDALRVPPNRIVVRVVEREPVGRVKGSNDAFDMTGARFRLLEGEAETLTAVRGDPQAAVPLLLAARGRKIRIEGVDARTRRDVRFRLPGSDVLVRSNADAERALESWAELRAAGVIERYQPEEVDLRFRGNAVLRGAREIKRGG
jgi:hypothetical protein